MPATIARPASPRRAAAPATPPPNPPAADLPAATATAPPESIPPRTGPPQQAYHPPHPRDATRPARTRSMIASVLSNNSSCNTLRRKPHAENSLSIGFQHASPAASKGIVVLSVLTHLLQQRNNGGCVKASCSAGSMENVRGNSTAALTSIRLGRSDI